MELQISSRGLSLTPELRDHIERRLYFALGCFAGRLGRVRVRVSDVNGPRGGVDKRCAINVSLPRLAPVIVEVLHENELAAVNLAAERAARAVSRKVNRSLHRRRSHSNAA